MKRIKLFFAFVCSAAMCGSAQPVGDSVEVASGLLSRRLDTRNGHLLGQSYKVADGTEFMRNGSPEFAFRVDGTMYAGWSVWKDVKIAKD